MSKKMAAPYPVSIQDGVVPHNPRLLRQEEQYLESLTHDPDDEEDGEYIEMIRSKPVIDTSRRYFEMNPVPNFSTSFQATRTAHRKVGPMRRRPPVPQEANSSKVNSMLRSSLQRVDSLLERTGSPILVRHKRAIMVICISVITWQLAILMDSLAQLVRSFCET